VRLERTPLKERVTLEVLEGSIRFAGKVLLWKIEEPLQGRRVHRTLSRQNEKAVLKQSIFSFRWPVKRLGKEGEPKDRNNPGKGGTERELGVFYRPEESSKLVKRRNEFQER